MRSSKCIKTKHFYSWCTGLFQNLKEPKPSKFGKLGSWGRSECNSNAGTSEWKTGFYNLHDQYHNKNIKKSQIPLVPDDSVAAGLQQTVHPVTLEFHSGVERPSLYSRINSLVRQGCGNSAFLSSRSLITEKICFTAQEMTAWIFESRIGWLVTR